MSKDYGRNAVEAINQIQLALQRLDMVAPDLNEIMGLSKVGAGIDLFKFKINSNSDKKGVNSTDSQENSLKNDSQINQDTNNEKHEKEKNAEPDAVKEEGKNDDNDSKSDSQAE